MIQSSRPDTLYQRYSRSPVQTLFHTGIKPCFRFEQMLLLIIEVWPKSPRISKINPSSKSSNARTAVNMIQFPCSRMAVIVEPWRPPAERSLYASFDTLHTLLIPDPTQSVVTSFHPVGSHVRTQSSAVCKAGHWRFWFWFRKFKLFLRFW